MEQVMELSRCSADGNPIQYGVLACGQTRSSRVQTQCDRRAVRPGEGREIVVEAVDSYLGWYLHAPAL